MTLPRKMDFPVDRARALLEPGPVVLVSSRHAGRDNIMTLGWHTVMGFSPSLIGCTIAADNHSFDMIRQSGSCVINLPTEAMVDTVVKIGNCSGRDVDKFAAFGLNRDTPHVVRAPLIRECHASFECTLAEESLIDRLNFFVFEIVKAHVADRPRHPRTLHYTGDGVFMVSGKIISRRHLFRPDMLGRGREE